MQHCNMQPDWTGCYSVETFKDSRVSRDPLQSAEEAGSVFTNP